MTRQWSLHYFSAPHVNTRSGTVSYVSHFENKLVTKERRRNEKFSEADAAQEKKWWIDLFWLGWKQLVDRFLTHKDVSHPVLGLTVFTENEMTSQVCGGHHVFPTSFRHPGSD